MRLFSGTSGFSYKEWKGNFYPEKLPNDEMLRFYAQKLSSVELNNTFYRMPRTHVLENWLEQVDDNFRFSVKASRRITHIKRIKNCADETEYLLSKLSTLGEKLGVILFQLPPHLKKDIQRLEGFFSLLPNDTPAAFEFRHPSWFDDEVLDALRGRNFALCVADTDDEKDCELLSTADWGYLRLRKSGYSKKALEHWAHEIEQTSWRRGFVFFKHEDAGSGPALASQFLQISRRAAKPRPRPPNR